MTIVLLLLLGISFLCALTLVAACMISGRNRDHSEETMVYQDSDDQPTLKPAVTALQTTSTRVTS